MQTEYDFKTGALAVVKETAFSDGERAKVRVYGANDVLEGVAIMELEKVDVSITGNSTNPTRFQHLVAGTYKKVSHEKGSATSPSPRAAARDAPCTRTTWPQARPLTA